jgi:predicted nucleic acid-binding protein
MQPSDPGRTLPRYVVDASIAIKWHLRGEEHMDKADLLLADFRSGRAQLLAPAHIHYEVANAIRTAVRTGRLIASDGQSSIEAFFGWNLPTVTSERLILSGYGLSLTYGCALYDGVYLALAAIARCPLVHADRRLHNTLGGRFPHELWIEEYSSN